MFKSLWRCIGLGLVGVLFSVSAGLLVSGCARPSDEPTSIEVSSATETPPDTIEPTTNQKINPRIRRLLDQLRADGVTAANTTATDFSSYSNQFIKIDNNGNIQSYIKVNELNPSVQQSLKSYGVQVQLINEKLMLIQANVPFYRISDVANYPFVVRIDPPAYGRTREPTSEAGG